MAKTTTLLGITAASIGLILLLLKSGNVLANAFDKAGLDPDTYTASAIQNEALVAAGFPVGSPLYEQAIDYAFDKALEDAIEFCGDTSVSWTALRGYFATCMV